MAGDAVTVARTLHAGESFGELALLQRGGSRAATVVSIGNTEFLTIAADQYENLLSQLHQAEIQSKVDTVRRCKIFR
jgi:CRP-like cAMP-binding protein